MSIGARSIVVLGALVFRVFVNTFMRKFMKVKAYNEDTYENTVGKNKDNALKSIGGLGTEEP